MGVGPTEPQEKRLRWMPDGVRRRRTQTAGPPGAYPDRSAEGWREAYV